MDLNFDFTEKRVIITAFFCMAFTIANLITVKIINIGFLGMETPAGVLIYPLVYILTNVIADVYGERTARRTIILGLCADILCNSGQGTKRQCIHLTGSWGCR